MIAWPLLIAALITVESSDGLKTVGDNGNAIGVLQIHKIYVRDCNVILKRKGTEFRYKYGDRHSRPYSIGMSLLYMKHYCEKYTKETGLEATIETAARIHNGGPDGWKKESTNGYWRKVQAVLSTRAE
jgi:hypothetical protein